MKVSILFKLSKFGLLVSFIHIFSNFAQDLEAKDMNRPVDEMRFDISDPRNPLNMRKRGKT